MRLPTRHAAPLVLVAVGLALAVIPGAALAQEEPAPPAPPAESEAVPAVPEAPPCTHGAVCTWPETDYQGELTELTTANKVGCQELPRSARAASNESQLTAVFYDSPGCSGTVVWGLNPDRDTPALPEAQSVYLRTPGAASSVEPESVEPESAGSGETEPSGTDEDSEPTEADDADPVPSEPTS